MGRFFLCKIIKRELKRFVPRLTGSKNSLIEVCFMVRLLTILNWIFQKYKAYPNFDKLTQNSTEFTKGLQFVKTSLTVNRYSFTCGTNEKT
jgi:hypothetical protein